MKRSLFVLGVAFWVIGEPAYAQVFYGPYGWQSLGTTNAPAFQGYTSGPSPYLPGQVPPPELRAPFALFYTTPVCHYAPGVWGWRQECF
jgi:hypothetical protein